MAQDEVSQAIGQYNWIPRTPYASPAYQVTPGKASYGVPYKMQGIPIQTCEEDLGVRAPDPYQKSVIFQPAKQSHNAGQYGIGQAPTNGIFTGVES